MKEEQLREVGGAERILKLDPLRPQVGTHHRRTPQTARITPRRRSRELCVFRLPPNTQDKEAVEQRFAQLK